MPIVALIHGLVGAIGLAALAITLQGPRRGDAMGVGSFGIAAAVLFGVTLTLGLSIWLSGRYAPRMTGPAIAVHATLAVTAFVLFLAWASIG